MGAIIQYVQDINVVWDKISSLDFTIQKNKMQEEEFEGWSQQKLDIVEEQYRRMLFLWVKYDSIDLPPSKDIDIFWHYHILDTRKYQEDCQKIFGYYQHHNPYFSMGSDKSNLYKCFENTLYFYEKEFKEELYETEETYVD
ncbi:glycine-rich domain-containing protein [Candidatus Tisiphia endosymbiont of Micropterix aruncella]|uniref:glycine-rich domain-containing protein n=1 Tax=Candidatus Tisiphia endosymbiont of Micropterix aruncella TaxID=3066271 RepID=UPI003AA7F1D6